MAKSGITIDCTQVLGDVPRLSQAVMGITAWNLLRAGVMLHKTLEGIADTPLLRRAMGMLSTGVGIDHGCGVYREDGAGNPIYDFTIVDQILDVIATPRSIPFFGLSFMPEALTSGTQDQLTQPWMRIDRFPPKDYRRWHDLIYTVVRRAVERYGQEAVAQWYWDFWNEPDLEYYWRGSHTELFKTYDYAAAAVRAAQPSARIGGPGPTDRKLPVFREFLEHCVGGTNHCTGGTGAPLDFITFHIKGGSTGRLGYFSNPWEAQDYERKHPSLTYIMETARWVLETIASVPGLKGLPVFFTECDIDWGTSTSIYHNPNMHYRNSEYFPAFQCAMTCEMLNLRSEFSDNPIAGTFLDTFYIPGYRFFEGQRTLTTGEQVDKPILNGLRLLGRLGKQRLAVSEPDSKPVQVLGTTDEDGIFRVMVVNFDESFDYDRTCTARIRLHGLGEGTWHCRHYRIDRDHSNAYTIWLSMGRPPAPNDAQLAALRERMGLELLEPTFTVASSDGEAVLETSMPPQSVSLWILERA